MLEHGCQNKNIQIGCRPRRPNPVAAKLKCRSPGETGSWSISDSTGQGKRRVVLDPENLEKGLAQLVLTVIELLRQLLERQALRRMEGDNLTESQIERMGQTFMKLEDKVKELREHFGLDEEDLNIHLGPLGDLM